MNLLELLDQLEAGIAALRDRARNGEHETGTRPVRKAGARSKARTKGKRSQNGKESKAILVPPPDAEGKTPEAAARVTGKRQALGRSLMQLRRPHGDTPGPH